MHKLLEFLGREPRVFSVSLIYTPTPGDSTPWQVNIRTTASEVINFKFGTTSHEAVANAIRHMDDWNS